MVYQWDGHRRLEVAGTPWWGVESASHEGLAVALLLHTVDDRELAERWAKAFARAVLGPLAGAPATIRSSMVERWVRTESRPLPAIAGGSEEAAVPCSCCGRALRVPLRHRGIVEVFGGTCDACYGALEPAS